MSMPEHVAPLPEPQENSGKATASLVFGIVSFFCGLLAGIPAIVLGLMGKSDIRASQGRLGGDGLATAGIVLGSITTALTALSIPIMIALLLPAINAARGAAQRAMCTNNMKQIGLALFNYQTQYGTLPPAYIADANGKPIHTWRALILPHLPGAEHLASQYDFDEPWDGPNNSRLHSTMPAVFGCPSATNPPGRTNYVAVVGPGLAFTGPEPTKNADIADPQGSTILLVESARPVNWLEPVDIDQATLHKPANTPSGARTHRNGRNMLMVDGSVRFISDALPTETLEAMLTVAGKEEIDLYELDMAK